MKKVVIGCGTGRCGTVSLAKAITVCDKIWCTHEMQPALDWEFNKKQYEDKKIYLNSCKSSIGDVALWNLPYVECFIKDLDAKVICLKRDRDLVVKSFLKHSKGFDPDGGYMRRFLPLVVGANTKERLEGYHSQYYTLASVFEQKYPDNFKIFDIDILNTDIDKIFDFIGIEKENRRYLNNYKFNHA